MNNDYASHRTRVAPCDIVKPHVALARVPGFEWAALREDCLAQPLVLQVHGQAAPLFMVVVCLEPSSDGVNDGFTSVFSPRAGAVSV